jgi:hypothetical protein
MVDEMTTMCSKFFCNYWVPMKINLFSVPLSLLVVAAILSAGSVMAQQVCKVDDSSGTPLNVRATPNGKVINALKNGRVVDIIESKDDDQGRSWVKIGGSYKGKYRTWGWVLHEFVSCRRKLLMPSNSTLHSPKFSGRSYAEFQGEAWVSGTLVALWGNGYGDRSGKEVILLLIPDDLLAVPQFDSYPPDIMILNEENILSDAFGQQRALRISSYQENNARVHGRFLIRNYKTGLGCDSSSWASATVLKIDIPRKQIATTKQDPSRSC